MYVHSMNAKTKTDVQAPKTVVNSIVHAMAILRHLGDSAGTHGVTAIAAALGISASSCFNILRTLVAEDLVEFDARKKTYSLGLGLFELGRRAISRSGILGLARAPMRDMVEKYDLTAGLWRVTPDGDMILVSVVESESVARIHFVVGQRVPRYAGASGRCFAAVGSASPEEIGAAIEGHPSPNRVPLDEYLIEVEETRRRGWAIDANTFRQGVTSIGVPVIDEDGCMRFSLTFSLFSGQHSPAIVDRIGREAGEIAASLSNRIFGTLRAA